jgi:hypothetical protein
MNHQPAYEYIPRPDKIAPEYLTQILNQYYQHKWNSNQDTVAAVRSWLDWPMVLRLPDANTDFTIMVNEGRVASVTLGLPKNPRILSTMLVETLQRIYYEETTSAIEAIGGRIKIRGNETERRRLLAAISYLTW